jgi:glycosyltransferase involved in cell wall biosynthesis
MTSRKLRILHTESSPGWGGQERRILAEAESMRQRGHELLVACDPRGELYGRARERRFPVFPLAFKGWQNLQAWWELRRLLCRQAVEVLNTHSSLDSWVGTLAWWSLRKRPLLVRTRHLSTRLNHNWPTRWLYRTPAAVITTSRDIKTLLHGHLGVPENRLFPVPTGVALDDFVPRPADPDLKKALGLPSQGFVFGTVAVLRSWKGHLYLLEAFQTLLARGADIYLLLVGEGPYRPVLEARVQELKLASRVRLAGYQDNVPAYLALMDTFVFPSYANEGVPQAVIQALAMGKAVVATNLGGIPEVIRPGETGLLVGPRDAGNLAEAMAQILADPELGRRFGTCGRELVRDGFSLEHMARAVETVYDRAIGNKLIDH